MAANLIMWSQSVIWSKELAASGPGGERRASSDMEDLSLELVLRTESLARGCMVLRRLCCWKPLILWEDLLSFTEPLLNFWWWLDFLLMATEDVLNSEWAINYAGAFGKKERIDGS